MHKEFNLVFYANFSGRSRSGLVCLIYTIIKTLMTVNLFLRRLLSNYVTWQLIREKVGLLSKPFRLARAEFNNKITAVKDDEDRWRTCTSITNDNLGVPIGSLYIQKYFDDSRINLVSCYTQRFTLMTSFNSKHR